MDTIIASRDLNLFFKSIELSGKRILAIGFSLIKVFSLETYEEILDIPSQDQNCDLAISADQKLLFVVSNQGLKQFSLSDFSLVKTYDNFSYGHCLKIVEKLNSLIISDGKKLMGLDLSTFEMSDFTNQRATNVCCIEPTEDEQIFFTTGGNFTLEQWDMDSRAVVKAIDLESAGCSLLVNDDLRSVFVGMTNGWLSEFSFDGLSLIRTVSVHDDWVSSVIRLSSGILMTCSHDGYVNYPFTGKEPTQLSTWGIYSITQLSDNNIACSCHKGLKVILPPPDKLCFSRLESISSSIQSILKSSSAQEPQLIALLQHHLSQLLTQQKPQPERFTGLSLSLLPDLNYVQRSHQFEGSSEGRKRIFSSSYFLETARSGSMLSEDQARLTLFDRKLKLLGRTQTEKDPLADFKVKEIRKEKWVFTLSQEISLSSGALRGPATAHFSNGYLTCYIVEGNLAATSGFQAVVKVDEVVKEISSIESDYTVFTSDRRRYFMNFKTNRIEELPEDH